MANNHNDGGAAFPRPGFTSNETESQEGMTLRDYFAGQAVAHIMAMHYGDAPDREIAKMAYEVADAMIAARGE